ncbi:MAG: MBOAT family protein [Magnetococcales bacterium]|nr:MBOAT family protein [Magnetococcales bacterium]
MIFNSVTFLLFLALVVSVWWALPQRGRLWLILVASLTFYGFWRWEFLGLMMVSATTDYALSLGMPGASPGRRRLLLVASVVVNLGLLFFFKYFYFFTGNAQAVLGLFGVAWSPPALEIVLPLGISFYTFQTISYTVDVYRGNIVPERDFLRYACFVTYFPQLVAGPILRAGEILHQLETPRHWDPMDLAAGLRRILYGLFLKVVLADNLAPLVDAGFAEPAGLLGAWDVLTLGFVFGFQIYFDFSAYSHIAIGAALLMGIRFAENFHFPYLATSPRVFWQRWHISLSSWIRDYLYLPLAGVTVRNSSRESRGGLSLIAPSGTDNRLHLHLALLLTWTIMGLWHGANWTFVLWGVYHALVVLAYRLLTPYLPDWPAPWGPAAGWLVTLPVMMLGWIPFRAQSVGDTITLYGRLFDPAAYLFLGLRENTYLVTALMLLAMVTTWLVRSRLRPWLDGRIRLRFAAETTLFAVAGILVFVFLRPINQFIYFQF